MMASAHPSGRATTLVDIVFPGDTNHHGTLFGGVGLAHMDKVAFIAASRHAPVDFVTASCERIDFAEPARVGDIIEFSGRVVRVGRRSLAAEVTMTAEAPLTGERRSCGRGLFTMVAVGDTPTQPDWCLPPPHTTDPASIGDRTCMVDLVFPEQTSHYGSLYGGNALAFMAKAAFVEATRRSRRSVVMVAAEKADFACQIQKGEVIEVSPRVIEIGRSSMKIVVELAAEDLRASTRRRCGVAMFTMVALDARQRPTPIVVPAA
jgi:acyl-CoA hydrolase